MALFNGNRPKNIQPNSNSNGKTLTTSAADSGTLFPFPDPGGRDLDRDLLTETETKVTTHEGDEDGEEEEEEETTPPILTTGQVIGIEGIWRNIVALKGRHYAAVCHLAGQNVKLMSAGEKYGQVRRLSGHINALSNPFAFYAMIKSRSMRGFIWRIDRKRQTVAPHEKDLREQYFIVRDDLLKKQRERSITQRDYFVTLQASPADLKSLAGGGVGGGAGNDEDDDNNNEDGQGRTGAKAKGPKGLWHKVKHNFMVYGLGRDPQSMAEGHQQQHQPQQQQKGTGIGYGKGNAKGKGKGKALKGVSQPQSQSKRDGSHPNPKIPAGLMDTLGFKAQSLADQFSLTGMGAGPMAEGQLIRVLAEAFNSRLTEAEMTALLSGAGTGTGKGSATSGPHLDLDLDPLDLIGRADFQEFPNYLKLGEDFITSLIVTEYPRNFRLGTLFNLIRFRDIRLSLALHVVPLSVKEAEGKLRSRQQLLFVVEAESKSQVGNMDRAYKLESLKQLRSILASGDARIFTVCLVMSVRATSKKRMREDLQRVSQRLTDMNFGVALPTRNQRRAWLSSLPLGHNFLAGEKLIKDRITHPNMTGENVACLLPNCVADFTQPGGFVLGRNKDDGSVVTFNRWLKTSTNPHTILVATTGAGKSVTQMLELLLEFLKNPDLEGHMIDIQNVLGPFCRSVGGAVIDLSLAGKACINPMDRYVCLGKPETIGERLSFLYALFTLMIKSELAPPERNAIGHAAKRLYHHFEDGESAVGTIYANFANNPHYAALRPYLLDYPLKDERGQESGKVGPGIMRRLEGIYAYLGEKYKIPPIGLVEGGIDPGTGQFCRPICRLYDGRWWYCGEGTTTEPYVEPEEITAIAPGKSRPAAVFYPHPEWGDGLMDEYHQLVRKEGLFDRLDKADREPAIRDAALELKRGMPILGDFLPFLVGEGAINLAASLDQYTDEELLGPVFNHFTNINLDSRFISWNCKDLEEGTLRPVRMFQVVNVVWARVRAYRKRRMFIADEFQTLVQNYVDVGNFIRDLFQRGRFFRLSMTAIVQNMSAFLDYPQALICCQNADRIVLMRQNPLAIDRLQQKFELTDGQVDILRQARQGEGLMKVGNSSWVHLQYEIPPQHLAAWDTNSDSASGQDEEDELHDYFAPGGDDEDDYDDI